MSDTLTLVRCPDCWAVWEKSEMINGCNDCKNIEKEGQGK